MKTILVIAEKVAEYGIDKFDQFLSAASKVMSQYGGDVAELGLNVLRVDAASNLVTPLVLLIVSLVYWVKVFPVHREWNMVRQEAGGYGSAENFVIGYCVPVLIVACLTCLSVIGLLDAWIWIGIFYPEAYAVHLFLLK